MPRNAKSFPQHILSLLFLSSHFLVIAGQPANAQGRLYKATIRPHWSADQQSLWYRNDLADGQREFILVDLRTGKRQAAFDHEALAAALTKAGLKGVQSARLPLDDLWFDLPNDSVTLRTRGKHFRYHRKLDRLENADPPRTTKKTSAPEKPDSSKTRRPYRPSRQVSPDGNWRAYIEQNNLFVRHTASDVIHQLSKDGTASHFYDSPYWGPDSKHLVAFRVRRGDNHQVHLIETSPKNAGRAKLTSRGYPLPGDRFTTHELNWFDIEGQKQVKPPVGIIDFHGPRLRWSVSGQHFRYQKIDRGHQRLRVIEVDTATGKHRDIIDEVSETFIWTAHARDLGVPLVSWLGQTDEIVYLSEKDGWRHLYLIDIATGKTKHQITTGEYVVRYVDRIDEEKRQIWFQASGRNPGQDPYLMHYYRVNFDGTGLTALTAGNGSHSIQYSPDDKHLIDTYSRVDSPPTHELRTVLDGKLVCLLEKADTREMTAAGWKPPEVFSAKGRDGKTDIWGIVVRPRNFDPKKKYPILEAMYAGPHDSYVPKTFSPGNRYASWTDLGFVVVKMDGMGTANRSKAFHDVCWQNLKDAGFPDRILWHQAFAAKHSWYDITRVGIYGGSAGGQSSTGALLFHPDFYKVAVSSCGCHDNRMDKASWNEQWMGYPVGPHYAASSNIDNAHRLRGRLMLIVGELDRNVPPESTYRLADALIKAKKDFELVVIPGGGHGNGGRHGDRRRRDFFLKHLQGIDPPNWNQAP